MNKKSHSEQRGQARVRLPDRFEIRFGWTSLDELIREDDFVRTVVKYTDSLDLSAFPFLCSGGQTFRSSVEKDGGI